MLCTPPPPFPRFNFQDGAVELYAERVANRGLCAQAQAESLKFKLLGGLAVRRACYGVVRFVMEASAKGVEVVVSGKLRGQRAKGMKVREGPRVVKMGAPYLCRPVRLPSGCGEESEMPSGCGEQSEKTRGVEKCSRAFRYTLRGGLLSTFVLSVIF